MDNDTLQLLSVRSLETSTSVVREFLELSRIVDQGIGWHYLIDFTWITKQLRLNPLFHYLDAGAGMGLLQWYLVKRGCSVFSADRVDRSDLSIDRRALCKVEGMRSTDLRHLGIRDELKLYRKLLVNFARNVRDGALSSASLRRFSGRLIIYNQDLVHLPELHDGSIDEIVSISSLEHNSLDGLRAVVRELMRVLKPGGRLIATISAARDQDFYHSPSKGWCLTEKTIRDVFELSPETVSNYSDYDSIMEDIRCNDFLKNNLAQFYFLSGDNGMPWGKWDPQYVPVGLRKVKKAT